MGDNEPVTLERKLDMIWNEVTKTNSLMEGYLKRLEDIENKCEDLNKRVCEIENEEYATTTEVQQKIKQSSSEIAQEIKEQCDRVRRENNIILMGITESDQSTAIIDKLLSLIVSNPSHILLKERIGKFSSSQKYPRPVRVVLPSSLIKQATLRNCKILKGIPEFAKVSVQKDLTKIQQLERASPAETRSRKKRKLEENEGAQTPKSSQTYVRDQSSSSPMTQD